MRPIETERTNLVYGAGDNPGVVDLPCERAVIEGGGLDGAGVIYSVWEFSEEEREFVARGGNLKVGIVGMEPIPPVSLQVVHEGMGLGKPAAGE